MTTVLITTYPQQLSTAALRRMLEQAGCSVRFHYPTGTPSEDEMIGLLQGVTGLIAGGERLTERVFQAAPSLRIIARTGVGVDAIDLKAAKAHGIRVTITPGMTSRAVADLTVGLLLAVARRICRDDDRIRHGRWERTVGLDLAGKTLGLIGLGSIGKLVATRALAFDMKVIASDPYRDEAFAAKHGITYVERNELLAASDYVSLHLPFTPDVRGYIGEAELRRMKPSACLINTARGALVDEAALAGALRAGRLAGAGLDVFASEPPTDSPLLDLDNVVMTAHIGAWTEDTWAAMVGQAASEVIRSIQGLPALHAVVD